MKSLNVGDQLPDVELPLSSGETVYLSDYRGKQAVVLFFYPMDGSPVCTKEACRFRDMQAEFAEAGAVVMGVSGDTPESHEKFSASQHLSYPLVSDKTGVIRSALGVKKTLGILPSRVTLVIDREGILRHRFSSQLSADRHVQEALDAVKELHLQPVSSGQ